MGYRNSLLYFFFSKNKKPLYVDNVGQVQEGDDNFKKFDGSPAHLEESPDGWKSTVIKYARNIKYWGIFRDFTVPMKFYSNSGKILRDIMWSAGIEGICYLGILRLNKSQLPYTYEPFYVSELNFSKFKEDKNFVQIEALEGGVSKYLKAYENTEYEISIDQDQGHVNVLLDGFFLDCRFNYEIFGGFDGSGTHLLPVIFANGEGTQINLAPTDKVILDQPAPAGYEATSDQWILTDFVGNTDLHIYGTVRLVFPQGGQYTLRLRTSTNRTYTILDQFLNVAAITLSYDFNFVINEDENLFLEATWTGGQSVVYGESSFIVDFKNRKAATYCKGLYPYRVAEKLIEAMTGGMYGFKSDWLRGKKDIVLTSGDAIRQFPTSSIKISLAQLFNALGFFSAGLGIEADKIVIEPLSYFFKQQIIADLGEVSTASLEVADDLIFNKFIAGYEAQDYDDVNGRFEFNQGQSWVLPITKVIKDGELKVTGVRADPFGIEFIRINLEGLDTTDNKGDNDTFMLNVEDILRVGSPDHYRLYRPPFTAISGVPDTENIFNVLLSPKHGLLNNGSLIRSICDKLDAEYITQTSADKNVELSCTLNGVTVAEKEKIQVGSLGARYFLPYYFILSTPVPFNTVALIKQNTYGKVRFIWNGQKWTGFLCDGNVNPATNEQQNWKLIVCPENDLSKFNA